MRFVAMLVQWSVSSEPVTGSERDNNYVQSVAGVHGTKYTPRRWKHGFLSRLDIMTLKRKGEVFQTSH